MPFEQESQSIAGSITSVLSYLKFKMFNFECSNLMLKFTKTRIEMKIAIPTNDGFTINQHFTSAKGFLVSTIQFGEVIEQEMRWNPESEVTTSVNELYQNIFDCEKVIVREIGFNQSNFLQLQKKTVIKTQETIITNILMQYLQTILLKESDIYCCP